MSKRPAISALALALASAALFFAPSPRTVARDEGRGVRARVLAVDASNVSRLGLLDYGTERLEVEVLDGPRAGCRFRAENELRAQLDVDKRFAPGDTASVSVAPDAPPGETLVARDHWRLGWEAVLFALFCASLVAFAGWTGAKALFSFVFSCLVVWKGLMPLLLAGWPASATTFAAVSLLTGVIMFLVAGFTRKGATAFLGAMLGVLAGLALAHAFGALLHVNGATMPFAQALLYSGYEQIDLADVFTGAVILASSGAVMDLAMDIAAGVDEVARHSPELPSRALLLSGLRIGRSVVGTMTTTLLLAYSGGFLTLLAVFAAQGTHPCDILNSTLVSAEVMKTLVGSFALVLVAPFTALVGARLLRRRVPTGGAVPSAHLENELQGKEKT